MTIFQTIPEELEKLKAVEPRELVALEEEPSAEEMFSIEQKPFRLAKPTHGPRAGGGSIGGTTLVQSHRSIPVVDDGIIISHQSHEDQCVAHPTCPFCAERDYKYRDVPMFGSRHEFTSPEPEPVAANTRVHALSGVSIMVVEDERQYFVGEFLPELVPLVRHLCSAISPKVKSRYKTYAIPPQFASLVPDLKKAITEKLSSKGLI
jgi:hypothetical protein